MTKAKTKKNAAPCEACDGVGWLNTSPDPIERCDACKVFANDDEAALVAAAARK